MKIFENLNIQTTARISMNLGLMCYQDVVYGFRALYDYTRKCLLQCTKIIFFVFFLLS